MNRVEGGGNGWMGVEEGGGALVRVHAWGWMAWGGRISVWVAVEGAWPHEKWKGR